MFVIKILITFCAAGSVLYETFAERDQNIQKRSGHGYVPSCPYSLEYHQLSYAYDAFHNHVSVDQRGGGQTHHVAVCHNDTGPTECPACCIGVDSNRFTSYCHPIQTLQPAVVCDNPFCSGTRVSWIYVHTGCACYYRQRAITARQANTKKTDVLCEDDVCTDDLLQ